MSEPRAAPLLDVTEDVVGYDPNAVTPPAEFPKLPDAFPVAYVCPCCKFGWSGDPMPRPEIEE